MCWICNQLIDYKVCPCTSFFSLSFWAVEAAKHGSNTYKYCQRRKKVFSKDPPRYRSISPRKIEKIDFLWKNPFTPCFAASTAQKLKKSCFWDFSEGAKKAVSRFLILWSSPIFGSKNPKKIFENFFSERTTRKLQNDHFIDPWNHMRAQKSTKKSKKSDFFSKDMHDPPRLLDCVI